jgi:hypothetical protein
LVYGSGNHRHRRIFLKHDEVQNSPNSPTRKQSSPQQATPLQTSSHHASSSSAIAHPDSENLRGRATRRGRGCHAHRPPEGELPQLAAPPSQQGRSTNSPAPEPKTSAVLPWLVTKALRKKNRRVPSTPPGTFQLNTCPATPLRWLRRLRSGGKTALAPLCTHQPETWPQNSLEGHAILRNPSAKAGDPRGASRGAAAAPATTVTPRGWAESHRLSALVQHRQPHSIPSARAAESHLSCHYRRNEARPRVAAGSKPGVRASRVVQRPRARVTAPIDHPGAPSPGRESFLTPLPDSFF